MKELKNKEVISFLKYFITQSNKENESHHVKEIELLKKQAIDAHIVKEELIR
jgi:hypothetical protein